MIANRPDWCISRQRSWGVPLPFFLHKESGELHPDTMALIDRAADIVQRGGVEAWSTLTVDDVLGDEAPQYTKGNDILDVWFDSGSTFFHVLNEKVGSHPGTTSGHDGAGAGPEADLYLEGHDQHRGWFHSSLLIACAMEDHAPYRGLLTHGFTVDGSGRKMSKSLGNYTRGDCARYNVCPSAETNGWYPCAIRLVTSTVASSPGGSQLPQCKGCRT